MTAAVQEMYLEFKEGQWDEITFRARGDSLNKSLVALRRRKMKSRRQSKEIREVLIVVKNIETTVGDLKVNQMVSSRRGFRRWRNFLNRRISDGLP